MRAGSRSRSPQKSNYRGVERRDGADTIYLGNFLTMEEEFPTAKAVAVRDGFIAGLGETNPVLQQWQSQTTEVVDLTDAGCVIPGFVESHCHPLLIAERVERVDCSPDAVQTLVEVQERLAGRASLTPPGGWVQAWGLEPCLLQEFANDFRPVLLRRGDLDVKFPKGQNHKLSTNSLSLHLMFTNKAALDRVGIGRDTPDPEGGIIVRDEETGEPTGELKQKRAFEPVLEAIKEDEAKLPGASVEGIPISYQKAQVLATALHSVARTMNHHGVTTVHDLGVGVFSYIDPMTSVRTYELACAEPIDKMPLRILAYTHWDAIASGYRPSFSGNFPRENGNRRLTFAGVKLHADGSLQGGTGFLSAAYMGRKSCCRGSLLMGENVLKARILDLHAAGTQVAVHANGDACIEKVIDAFEEALQKYPRTDHRHRIEHCQTATMSQLERMAKLGLAASFFANHVYTYGDAHRDRFLGPERAHNISPAGWARKLGVRFGFHSDCPITPSMPLRTIWTAVTRTTMSGKILGPDQRIGVMDALRAYTIDNAWLGGEETLKGSLAPGKLADMAILSASPLEVSHSEIANITVQAVVVGGKLLKNSSL